MTTCSQWHPADLAVSFLWSQLWMRMCLNQIQRVARRCTASCYGLKKCFPPSCDPSCRNQFCLHVSMIMLSLLVLLLHLKSNLTCNLLHHEEKEKDPQNQRQVRLLTLIYGRKNIYTSTVSVSPSWRWKSTHLQFCTLQFSLSYSL